MGPSHVPKQLADTAAFRKLARVGKAALLSQPTPQQDAVCSLLRDEGWGELEQLCAGAWVPASLEMWAGSKISFLLGQAASPSLSQSQAVDMGPREAEQS